MNRRAVPLLLACLLAACAAPLPPDAAKPAHVAGAPLRLHAPDGRIVLLLEFDVVHWGYSARSGRKVASDIPHVELWAWAAEVPARPLWRRRFAPARPGIMTSASDYLVLAGDRLHVGLAEPVAVAADGADPQAAPLPADGERGGSVHGVGEVMGRGRWRGERFTGLLGDEERARLDRRDGARAWRPDPYDSLGADVDYALYAATVHDASAAPDGWPAGLPDRWGTRREYSQWQRLPDTPRFRRAGVLRAGDRGEPLPVPGSDDLLVLHAASADDAEALAISRVDSVGGGVRWRASLPRGRIAHLLPGGDVLAIVGDRPVTKTGADYEPPTQWLFLLDLRDGRHDEVDLADVRFDGAPTPLP